MTFSYTGEARSVVNKNFGIFFYYGKKTVWKAYWHASWYPINTHGFCFHASEMNFKKLRGAETAEVMTRGVTVL